MSQINIDQRQEVIEWLQGHNYPALPVAPVQNAFKYHKIVHTDSKKGIFKHCPLTADLQPTALYTGKNPSYLDREGKPHSVNHRHYQNRLPSEKELETWFAHPANGVGTLGGWNNAVWLDFDVPKFSSQQDCDDATLEVSHKVRQNSGSEPFLERSHSGGWRIGVRVKQKPNFTNFALTPGGVHVGEALFEGRFTVLAPTIGSSGNAYKSLNRVEPPSVESLESIGIYSIKSSRQKEQHQDSIEPSLNFEAIPGTIPLEELGNRSSREILAGANPKGDRSHSLTTAINEWWGWVNWTTQNGVDISGNPEELAHHAGKQLGLDSDRINRVFKSVKGDVSLEPAALRLGGEQSCWNKIYRLDKATFAAKCPAHIKDAIKAERQRVNSTLPSDIGFTNSDYPGAKSAVRQSSLTSQKLSLKEAVVKAREILTAESDELVANIKLEEIREACGMSEFGWEHKIIKPLKRNLESERFKLELLGLLRIDDSVERIRQQALMAPKYQMSSRLIEKAMSAMKQRTQTPEAKALDLDELFDLESSGLSWVIPGLLPEKETIVLAGAPKAGKTLLAIDAAYAIATGESYFLGEATKRGKVLLVSTDESANSTKAKLINRGFRRGDKGCIKVLTTWDITQMGTLEALLEDFRPDLVIIDSLRRINKGSEISENSAEFADAIYTLKETLERYGASGILIHHTNKNPEALGVHRLRGSSAIAGAVWGTWQLDQIPKPDPNNKKKLIIEPKDPTRTLSVFARDIEGQQLTLELNPENSSWVHLGEVGDSIEAAAVRDTLQTRILRLLSIPTHALGLSGSEIIERLDDADVENKSVYNCLNRMVTKRVITCKPAPGDKRYNIYALPNCHTPDLLSANCHTPEISLPPPSPPPTDPKDDYNAESTTTYGLENSHHNSHHPQKISHHPDGENPTDDYSNVDSQSDSEIVITCPALGEGGGVENATPVTVAPLEVSHAPSEPNTLTKLSVHLSHPALQLAALLRLAECWSEVEEAISTDPDSKTDAWAQLTPQEQSQIRALKSEINSEQELNATLRQSSVSTQFQVGFRVNWSKCPANCEDLSPFVIDEIHGDEAKLDLFAKLVPLVELELAT